MSRFRILNTLGILTALIAVYPAAAQDPNQTRPAPPSPGAPSGPGVRTQGLQGSPSGDAYPTAVQCAEVQGQARAPNSGRLTPLQRRIMQQCDRLGGTEPSPKQMGH
jgi:hypothetical protein